MIIITSHKFISTVFLVAHSMNIHVQQVNTQEIINSLDESEEFHERCYCWTGDDKNVPEEVDALMSYKNLCAEEFEFESLYEGDTVFAYTMVETDEGTMRPAWHMILFDEICR